MKNRMNNLSVRHLTGIQGLRENRRQLNISGC